MDSKNIIHQEMVKDLRKMTKYFIDPYNVYNKAEQKLDPYIKHHDLGINYNLDNYYTNYKNNYKPEAFKLDWLFYTRNMYLNTYLVEPEEKSRISWP